LISGSNDRLEEGLLWDRDTLFPKFHLNVLLPDDQKLALVESQGSIMSHDFTSLLQAARYRGRARPDGVVEPHRCVLDVLGAEYLLLPNGFSYPGLERIAALNSGEEPSATLWRNPTAFPRAWIVGRVELRPPLSSNDPAAAERRAADVLFVNGQPRDLRTTAIVESDRSLAPPLTGAYASGDQQCRVVVDQPERVELEVRLSAAGLVVLSDLYDPAWTVHLRASEGAPARPAPMLRTNRIMRGVILPPGDHRLVFQYQPRALWVGMAISGASWLLVAIGGVIMLLARISHPRRNSQLATRNSQLVTRNP
jgi:hypothetical protein